MWAIEPFRRDHDTSSFDCGDQTLNSWLKNHAEPWTKQGLCRVFVATESGSNVVQGYYTLSAHHVVYEALPKKAKRGLPETVDIPAVLLGRLAVDKRTQGGRDLGTGLLFNALARTILIADADEGALGIRVFEVEAYESARDFYLNRGLRPLEDDPNHLFVSLKEIRRLQTDGDLPAPQNPGTPIQLTTPEGPSKTGT